MKLNKQRQTTGMGFPVCWRKLYRSSIFQEILSEPILSFDFWALTKNPRCRTRNCRRSKDHAAETVLEDSRDVCRHLTFYSTGFFAKNVCLPRTLPSRNATISITLIGHRELSFDDLLNIPS